MEGGETACAADGRFQREAGGEERCHEAGEGVGAVDEVREERAVGG